MQRQTATASHAPFPPILGFIVAVAVLYFARDILVPFALALLFAFLLSPIVKRLELLRIPSVPAVILVLIFAFGALGSLGWVVTNQLFEIVNELPRYRENIHRKIEAVKLPSGSFSTALQSVEELGKELTTTAPSHPPAAAQRRPAKSAKFAAPPDTNAEPIHVQVIAPPPNALQSLRNFLGPLLGPVETAGVVIVFTIFMLLDRIDLRNRLLSLIGQNQMHLTTRAMNDAAQRVSRYLLMQFLVNATFGAVIALGLFLIGVQSSLLWGALGMLLRFLPYAGPVMAGVLPFALAVATTEGWKSPLLVFALFVVVELITGNFVEPLVYGAHTGLSAVAMLLSLVFWTALWGPVGLILSTPLTVCLSVLGRYSPHLQFLEILLGDTPVLPLDAMFYQRLLALDQQDALNLIDNFLKDKPMIELFDTVIIPAVGMAEKDRHGGSLEPGREEFVVQSINEFVTELAETGARQGMPAERRKENRIFCIPAFDAADEVTSAMLAQIAGDAGFPALAFPVTETPAELLQGLAVQAQDIICVSSVPPLAITHARTVSQQIREVQPDAAILIGLWCYAGTATQTIERLEKATSSTVVTSLAAALAHIQEITPAGPERVAKMLQVTPGEMLGT